MQRNRSSMVPDAHSGRSYPAGPSPSSPSSAGTHSWPRRGDRGGATAELSGLPSICVSVVWAHDHLPAEDSAAKTWFG